MNRQVCLFTIIIALMYAKSTFAQQQESDSSVLQQSYSQIAEQVVEHLQALHGKNILVMVYDTTDKFEVENAFLRVLQAHRFNGFLKRGGISVSVDSVVELTVQAKKKRNELQVGDISKQDEVLDTTIVDVQWYDTRNGAAGALGPFTMVQRVTMREIKPVTSQSNWIEKYLTPILAIGSSVLIVYLFFVVRS